MKGSARYRFVATLTIAGLVGGAWACGATAPLPEDQLPGDDEGDATLPFGDGQVPPYKPDTGYHLYDGGYDGYYPFDAYDPFDAYYPEEGDFYDGYFNDAYYYDSYYDDGGYYDAEPPPDAGPPWDGGAPVTITAGEQQPVSLALDGAHVYWENSGGTVLSCPLSGCPNNVPTLLAFNGEDYDGIESIAAGASTAFFITSSSSVDSCASGGCNLAPATYFADPGGGEFEGGFFFDGGGGSVDDLISDATNLYFTDSTSIYSCPIASTCSSATTLVTSSLYDGIGMLAVSATEVFYVDDGGNSAQRIRAVPIAGGTPRVVCKSSNYLLYGVNSMVVAGGYVYFTSSNDSSSIYQCLAAGGGAPTIFANDEAPYGLATDGANLYWTNDSSHGLIGTCPVGSSCVGSRTIASGQKYPQAIAVNSTAVYWTTNTGIYSAAK